jgi:serine/threonine protein kinase
MQPEADYMAAIQHLVPRRSGFEAGFERKIVSGAALSHAAVPHVDLTSWVTGTVLMPHVDTRSWADVIRFIREGSQRMSRIERLMLARRLSEAVGWLESSNLAHRDLSSTNVLINVMNVNVHLIDWDGFFQTDLNFQLNAITGSSGYLAPFLKRGGVTKASSTWTEHADRFALAVLNAELLTVNAGSRQHADGGLLDQADLFNHSGPTLLAMRTRLQQVLPAAALLFDVALNATNFDECPGPGDWLTVINAGLDQTAQTSRNREALVEEMGAIRTAPDEPHFVEIQKSAFVKIDPQVFVKAPKRRAGI